MNGVDGSEHYERETDEPPPSLLAVVLDTNPHAWAYLSSSLPFSKVIANLLVFINAHLAFNNANRVAVVASHSDRAQWLYPAPDPPTPTSQRPTTNGTTVDAQDTEMTDSHASAPPTQSRKLKVKLKLASTATSTGNASSESTTAATARDANKFRPFRQVEDEVLSAVRSLLAQTSASSLSNTTTTMLAGALTLALTRINKETILLDEANGRGARNDASGGTSGADTSAFARNDSTISEYPSLVSRILVLSVSGDSAAQYIPVMNCIFAAQRHRTPIDVLKIHGDSTFLQQAADATNGVYVRPESPQGLLQYLMMAFLPDRTARKHLVMPTQGSVDFRAACFCHKRVVDIGFVCSICLSIFCEPLEDAICLTCGTYLTLGDYGAKPAVVAGTKKKKKKKRTNNNAPGSALLSGAGTPIANASSPGTPAGS